MAFLDRIKERAKAEKKTIVLPESMDRRTWEAAEKVLKEDIADIIIIGTPEEIAANGEGLDISKAHNDCGMIIYNRETQDVHSGGSGCGCAATVLGAYILPKLA